MSTIKKLYENQQPNPSEKLDIREFSNQILSMTAFRLISDHPSNSGKFVDLNADKPGEKGVWHREDDVDWIYGELRKLYENDDPQREFSQTEMKRFYLIRYLLAVRNDVNRFFDGDFSMAFKIDPDVHEETLVTEGSWEERIYYQKIRNALNISNQDRFSVREYADYINTEITPLMGNLVEARESEKVEPK